MNRAFPTGLVVLAVTQTAWTQQPRTHELSLAPESVHWGYYDSRVPPVLRITSGERVRVETMVAGGLQRFRLAGASESEIPESLKAVERGVSAAEMDARYSTQGAAYTDSIGHSLNLGVNELADVLHTFFLNVVAGEDG